MTKPLVTTAENIHDNTITYCYNDCIFVTPRFRQDTLPIKLVPKQITVDTTTCANILSCVDKTWDESEFKNIRQPIVAARVVNQKLFSSPINNAKRVLDMPIKFPNSSTYIIPQECSQFTETIQQIIDYYHSLYNQLFNSDQTLVNDYYCYLTIDQGFVPKGTMQRKSGLHVDGFQGERVQPKVKINHSFIVSDCVPAVYYIQPFDTSALDPSVHDYFLAFERQVSTILCFKIRNNRVNGDQTIMIL